MDHEGYKTAIRNWLTTEPPDVVFWFSGESDEGFCRPRTARRRHRPLEKKTIMTQAFKSTLPSMTVRWQAVGYPSSRITSGAFYTAKTSSTKYGISVPKTWDEFLAAGKKLKENGIIPVTIGTKFPWTAAGWFDYLDFRTNGYDFHIQLMDGKVSL